MKYVIAINKPFRPDDVREAPGAIGVQGITVTGVRDLGRQKGYTEFYRGAEYTVSFMPEVRLEPVVDDTIADHVVETVEATGQTGRTGDGKIFVLPLGQAVRIRTGETGQPAL
jgi:nitrogen regulatory protein PII